MALDGAPWEVLALAQGAAARIELRRYTLPRPNEMWEIDDEPILSVVMPRAEGTQGEVMFDLGDRQRHRVGRLMLRPAGIAMHSRGDGGVLDILTCRFNRARFEAATGLRDWDSYRLSRCAAIVSPQLMALSERLREEALAPGFASALVTDALVELLMVDLARLFQDRSSPLHGGLAAWQLARIEEALRCSVGDWPTTQTLAALCGISRSHLSRSFTAATGKALSAHAAAIRLERAGDMLRAGSLPMNRIAGMLGFASASAFSAAFRRATGQTPRRFRQNYNGSAPAIMAPSTARH
jgi:AraC family transcriptional regulator